MKGKVDIGALNERIEIQQETTTRGSSGQYILAWERLAYAWAKVDFTDTGSGEQIRDDKVVVSTSTSFIIRYISGITEKMRIVYRGDNYSITNIYAHDRARTMTLQAQKVE